MAQYDGSIRINTQINTKGLRQGEGEIKSSMGRISSSANKLAKTIAAAFAVGKLLQFGKTAIELGSDLEEVQNVVDVTFTTMSEKVNEFAKSAAASAGLSETMAKRYVGTFGAMSKSFGFTEAEAYNMSTALTQLTGDVASFYNISQDLAYIKLKSVFTGETETLKDLGVVMTQSALDAYAMANGFGKTTDAMTEQEKVALRLRFVQDQLLAASGDFIRTSDSWANQVRIMQLQIQSLKATIGQGLINLFTPLIKVINIILSKLATLANAFKAFTALITGKKTSAGGGGSVLSSGGELADTVSGYEDAAGAADDLAKSTEKAAKATKDAQKAAEGYLSPLDEINKISKESDISTPDTGGAGGGVGGTASDIDYGNLAEGESIIDKMSDSLSGIIDRVKELAGLFKKGFFEGLGDYKPRLEDLKNDIQSIGQTLKDIFTDPEVVSSANRFANQLAYSLGQVSGSVASIGITIAQLFIGGLEKYLSQNAGRVKEYIVEMFDIGTEISAIIGNFAVAFADIFSVFGSDVAQQIAGNLIGIFVETRMMISENAAKLGRDILNMITQPIIDNKDKIKTALEGTLQAIEPFTSGLLTVVQTVRDEVSDVYDNHLKPLFDTIASGLTEVVGKLLDGYNKYIVPILQGLGEKFKELMEGPFGDTLDKVYGYIGRIIDIAKSLWENVLIPLFSWIADNIMPVLAPIVEFIGTKLLNRIETMIKVIGDIFEVLNGLIDFIVGVFTGDWGKAWDGVEQIFNGVWELITDIISGKWQQIKNIVKTGLSLVSTLISTVWNAISSVTRTVWNAITSALSNAWNVLKTLSSNAFNAIRSIISTIWNGIRTETSNIWNGIKSVVSNIWNGIKTTASNAFNGIKNTIVSIWENLRSTTSRIWQGIVSAVKSPINSIIGLLNGLISGMASAVNGIANMFNSMRIDIPDWVPGIGGGKLGFNLPHWNPGRIPYLATGTVVPPNREFMAVLGDNKREPEVVSPLSTIEQAMENVMSRHSNSGGNEKVVLQVVLDRKVLAESTLTWGEIQQMSTGKNPFMLNTT